MRGLLLTMFRVMRRLKVRSRVGLVVMALLLSGCTDSCFGLGSSQVLFPEWRFAEGSPENICQQFIDITVKDGYLLPDFKIELALDVYNSTFFKRIDPPIKYVKTGPNNGYFEVTVGDTLPSDAVPNGFYRMRAEIFETYQRSITWIDDGPIQVSDCDKEPDISSSAAPETNAATSEEPSTDDQQPVSNLKAEFHRSNTLGCPFVQAVDVAGVVDDVNVRLKLSIDGAPVDNTAEFITEGEYVEEGFDGYFDLVAGDDFDATLEGQHVFEVEVSDGTSAVTIEGTFTADSC